METNKNERVTWVCRECGAKRSCSAAQGKPLPGMCVKYNSAGKRAPHVWVKF